MIELTHFEKNLHARALAVSSRFRKSEMELVAILEDVERSQLYRKLGLTSVFQYARKELKLSEAVAGSFIAVARKAREIPELKRALRNETLSVSIAHKMVSALTNENSLQLINYAQTHSCRELERKIAGINPTNTRDQVRAVSEDQMKIQITISKQEYDILLRAQNLLCQKSKTSAKLKEIIIRSAKDFIERYDPLEKARRQKVKALKKSNAPEKKAELITNPSREGFGRKPLTAPQKHAVFLKTQGRCTYTNQLREQCDNERWLHIHHVLPVSMGGGNQPENLTHLCWHHHDLVHQLPLPMDLDLQLQVVDVELES